MPTGQPRDHCSVAQVVSKYSLGLSASSPKNEANSPSTRERRSLSDRRAYSRHLSPPTKPKITPGPPGRLGESSNVALTRPSVATAVPLRPLARQNGLSYCAATLVRAP